MNYQEYKQSLNQKLTNKVQKELSAFREKLQDKPPQEIYDAAYQIAIKNDIAECFSDTDYSPQAAKALMKSPILLQEIYEEWLATDYSHMEDLCHTIADFKEYEERIAGYEADTLLVIVLLLVAMIQVKGLK